MLHYYNKKKCLNGHTSELLFHQIFFFIFMFVLFLVLYILFIYNLRTNIGWDLIRRYTRLRVVCTMRDISSMFDFILSPRERRTRIRISFFFWFVCFISKKKIQHFLFDSIFNQEENETKKRNKVHKSKSIDKSYILETVSQDKDYNLACACFGLFDFFYFIYGLVSLYIYIKVYEEKNARNTTRPFYSSTDVGLVPWSMSTF